MPPWAVDREFEQKKYIYIYSAWDLCGGCATVNCSLPVDVLVESVSQSVSQSVDQSCCLLLNYPFFFFFFFLLLSSSSFSFLLLASPFLWKAGSALWKVRRRKVLYCMRRTLIFESRLRKIENEVSKSAVLCSQYSHFREQAPHCLKVRC